MKTRCKECKIRLNPFTEFKCKCKNTYCSKHRLASDHNCTYDHKKEHIERLQKTYRRITPKKIVKI